MDTRAVYSETEKGHFGYSERALFRIKSKRLGVESGEYCAKSSVMFVFGCAKDENVVNEGNAVAALG